MTRHGDAELHDNLLPRVGDRAWAAAIVKPSGTKLAAHGIDLDAGLEIGSISKGITGLLYCDAVARGEISPDDLLGDHLPVAGSRAGRVTLASLSTHTSGLPTLPSTWLALSRTASWLATQRNPYGETLDELLNQVRGTKPGRSGRHVYSNIGFQLLGHAVASAAGTSYRELVSIRIAEPLGLSSLHVPATRDDLWPDDVIGRSRWGRVAQPWTGEAFAPAGGIRMSITDVARLASALLDGSAPGVSALDPVSDFGRPGTQIGAAWITSPGANGPVTWHNGATGGFRAWLGLDRDAGCAAALVHARVKSPDRDAARMLAVISAA